MARIDRIRNNGAIPERRHDAFLLALLLAVAINIAFFAVQAILPTLAHLLRLLGPEPALQQQEEEQMPFVLVDPSFLDEEVTPDAAAESFLNRDARQTQETDLPEDQPFIEEGVEEILSPPEGSMGPELGTHDAPETPESEAQPTEEVEARQQDETAGEDVPAAIYDDTPEPAPEEESPAEPEPLPPEPEPLPEPPAEPVPPEPPPPEAPPPEPEPVPEPVPEPPPEPFIPPPPAEVPPEPIPEPEPVPDPPMDPPPEPAPHRPPPDARR
ncbi:MAG: hypothetical protein LUE17_04940, partial [Planctomycetaceae bacterium]|nr:hypothetical protein [Planctomycetaceae bacterium]